MSLDEVSTHGGQMLEPDSPGGMKPRWEGDIANANKEGQEALEFAGLVHTVFNTIENEKIITPFKPPKDEQNPKGWDDESESQSEDDSIYDRPDSEENFLKSAPEGGLENAKIISKID